MSAHHLIARIAVPRRPSVGLLHPNPKPPPRAFCQDACTARGCKEAALSLVLPAAPLGEQQGLPVRMLGEHERLAQNHLPPPWRPRPLAGRGRRRSGAPGGHPPQRAQPVACPAKGICISAAGCVARGRRAIKGAAPGPWAHGQGGGGGGGRGRRAPHTTRRGRARTVCFECCGRAHTARAPASRALAARGAGAGNKERTKGGARERQGSRTERKGFGGTAQAGGGGHRGSGGGVLSRRAPGDMPRPPARRRDSKPQRRRRNAGARARRRAGAGGVEGTGPPAREIPGVRVGHTGPRCPNRQR
jgi:hypothetical protein